MGRPDDTSCATTATTAASKPAKGPVASLASMFLVLLLLLFRGAEAGEAHPHAGKASPFPPGDPGIRLDAASLRVLRSGHPLRTQVQSGSAGGRGMVVQDVRAPPPVVWDRILDFEAYPKMVPKTVESQVYKRELLKDGTERIWVRMKVGFPLLKLQFFVSHLHDPARKSLTWTLDYSARSDLDDSVGFWYVVPHPDDPENASRVYYSVDVRMFSWVPSFVVDFMSRQALVDATAWVKKYSELEAQKSPQRSAEGSAASSPPASSGTAGQPPSTQKRWVWGERRRSRASASAIPRSTGPSVSTEATHRGEPETAVGGGADAGLAAAALKRRSVLVLTALAVLLYSLFALFVQQ